PARGRYRGGGQTRPRRELGVGRAAPSPQHPTELSLGPVGRPRLLRARYLCPARRRTVDLAPPPRPFAADPSEGGSADRLSSASRQDHLRPALLGLHLEYQPRGGSAAASAPARPGESDRGQL